MFSIDNLSCLSFYDQGLLEERMDFFFIQIGTKAMVRNEFYIRLQSNKPISICLCRTFYDNSFWSE